MDEKIEIITKYHKKPPRADGKLPGVDYVERTVILNGEIMYTDRIKIQMYTEGKDPITILRRWLYGRRNQRPAKVENLRDVIEARREMIEQGRIQFLTLLNLKLKVLQCRLYLGFLKFKHFLLGGKEHN